jgi:hypothetical protein
MIPTRTIIQLSVLAICCGCIIAGITLCILDFIKVGIALIVIGFVVGILVTCDRQCVSPDTTDLAAVVVHEQPLRQQ